MNVTHPFIQRITGLVLLIMAFFTAQTSAVTPRLPAGEGCDSLPPLNRTIIDLLRPLKGEQVGRGECWDLAAKVLNETGAAWDGMYRFGHPADPWKECIYPGDIIQFEGVRLRYTEGRMTYTETMAHHTAIVWEVRGPGRYVLIHQNTGFSGRTVGLSTIDLKTVIKGKFTVFRPQER